MTDNEINELKKVKAVTDKYQYWLLTEIESGSNIDDLTFNNYCEKFYPKDHDRTEPAKNS
jgi:hypothetical protein